MRHKTTSDQQKIIMNPNVFSYSQSQRHSINSPRQHKLNEVPTSIAQGVPAGHKTLRHCHNFRVVNNMGSK